jgi:enoyl-CoA hydratase
MTGQPDPDLLHRVENGIGRLILNRPKALHALTAGMAQAMIDALVAWRGEPAVEAVMIEHAGERGFCAGGDIRAAARSGAGDGVEARDFFLREYQLNDLLFSYPKPVIAIMDGVTMGGGAGLAMPARYRVATPRTLFAMPESAIGLFPDVGGGWFLPRLPGAVGLWLALTGARFGAADCLAVGLATDFVAAERLEALKAALLAPSDGRGADARIRAALDAFADDPGPATIAGVCDHIDRLFDAPSVEAIMARLDAEDSAWAREQAAILRTRSPQTLKVAFRQLALGAKLARFSDNMAMEYRLAVRISARHDFHEGVRAVLIDKDNAPRWDPPTLEGVTEALLDQLFAPLTADQEWTPLDLAAPQGS